MAAGRITQQDVARKARVSRATVSMALKGNPTIPASTRERILTIAAKLGYTPDPMLAALAVYRSRKRPASFHGTLAWVVNSSEGYNWRKVRQFVEYYEGAVACAKRHGFQLEIFDLHPPEMSTGRLGAIFRARNVRGVLLCPQPRSFTSLDLPWEAFSSVTFGYTLTSPRLNTVISTQYQDALRAVREVQARGYRRIGLFLDAEHNLRTNQNYLAGYLVGQSGAARGSQLPPCHAGYDDVPALGAWLDRVRPDAVIACGGKQCLDAFGQLGIKVPRDLGVTFPNLSAGEKSLSGVVEISAEIGSVAVDLLVAMVQRGERGVPANPLRIQVEGEWQEGATLKPQSG